MNLRPSIQNHYDQGHYWNRLDCVPGALEGRFLFAYDANAVAKGFEPITFFKRILSWKKIWPLVHWIRLLDIRENHNWVHAGAKED